MSHTQKSEIRELNTDELDAVSGGWVQTFVGLGLSLIADGWDKTPWWQKAQWDAERANG